MNAHDSERIKGLLESLGLGEATDAGRGRRARLQHLHDPREARRAASPRTSCRRAALKQRDPGQGDRGRRLLRGGAAGRLFERYPFVDVAFGPGDDPAPRRLARRRRAMAPRGRFGRSTSRFAGDLPDAPRAAVPGLGADLDGLQLELLVLHRARRARPRAVSRPPGEIVAEVERLAGDGVREVTLLGQNVNSWGRDLLPRAQTGFAELLRAFDAVDGIERIRFTSPHPKDFRADVIAAMAECACGVRARAPAAAVGLDARS